MNIYIFVQYIKEKIDSEIKNSLKINNDLFGNLTQIERKNYNNNLEASEEDTQKLEKQNNEINELKKMILKLEEKINNQENEMKIKNDEILNLKNELNSEKLERIMEMNGFIKEIIEYKNKLEYQDNIINENNKKIMEQEKKINDQYKIIEGQKIQLNEQRLKLNLQELLLNDEKYEKKIDDNVNKSISHLETEI